jgi:hypothetical protein
MVCAYCQNTHLLNRNAPTSSRCRLPSVPTANPCGYCMNAFVVMMKYPDSHEPRNSMIVATR